MYVPVITSPSSRILGSVGDRLHAREIYKAKMIIRLANDQLAFHDNLDHRVNISLLQNCRTILPLLNHDYDKTVIHQQQASNLSCKYDALI